MLRIMVVLPLYLVFMFVLTKTQAYQNFHDAVAAGGVRDWHLIAYGGALALGLSGAGIIEFVIRPEGFGFGSVLRIIRMGFIGLILLGAYQLGSFYAFHELSVAILAIPVMFVAAEIVYELVEYLTYRFSNVRSRARRS